MSTTIKIDFKPKKVDWEYIQNWLIEEDAKSGTGFYCNIDLIKQSFVRNKMVVITVDNKAIGFVTWYLDSASSARVDITEIHPNYRKLGYGRVLVNHLFQYFVEKNIYTVDLQCAPVSSVHFWKKIKFREFPKHEIWVSQKIELYKILVDTLKPVALNPNNTEVIELWSGEPYETKDLEPVLRWKLGYIKGTKKLKKPIITLCDVEWRIRWRKGNDVFYDGEIKRFAKLNIQYGRYLAIVSL